MKKPCKVITGNFLCTETLGQLFIGLIHPLEGCRSPKENPIMGLIQLTPIKPEAQMQLLVLMYCPEILLLQITLGPMIRDDRARMRIFRILCIHTIQ